MSQPEVVAIAKVHSVSAAQVGLKWIVQQGLPLTTAIWELDYMTEDLDLWSWGSLTAAEMKTLSAVARCHARRRPGDTALVTNQYIYIPFIHLHHTGTCVD
jgi:diketogulonate reductase-like aldo/keto reductase